MNPGSSQFNAQFPDVEEVMESKKLQTVIRADGALVARLNSDLYHDARIVHEQREVILQLASALAVAMEALEDGTPMEQADAEVFSLEALTAAAPFLED